MYALHINIQFRKFLSIRDMLTNLTYLQNFRFNSNEHQLLDEELLKSLELLIIKQLLYQNLNVIVC